MMESSTAIFRASTICMVWQTEPMGSHFASLGRAKMLRELASALREIVADLSTFLFTSEPLEHSTPLIALRAAQSNTFVEPGKSPPTAIAPLSQGNLDGLSF
jgi:hypothetical protein